jgi:hypothetical protein
MSSVPLFPYLPLARGLSRDMHTLARQIHCPDLPLLIRRFLYTQTIYEDGQERMPEDVPIEEYPSYTGKVVPYPSAVATFLAPSDKSGRYGMYRERIRSTQSWRGGPPRRDCVFVEADGDMPGFRGLLVGRVMLFFTLFHDGIRFPCALVTWFSTVGAEPDPDTGMWVVEPDRDREGNRVMDIIHIGTILRSAHLIGLAGEPMIPRIKYSDSLDAFRAFYINKYADHHAHEIAF